MALLAVVGLGNPGEEYRLHRHNAGFMVVDELARRLRVKFASGPGPYQLARKGETLLMKPTTFMNESGRAVAHLVEQYDIDFQNLMVVYDDLDLPFPSFRIRKQGGPGGHKGMQSIVNALDTTGFPRLRLGIGGRQGNLPAEVFVLQNYSAEERPQLQKQIELAAEALHSWLKYPDLDRLMNRYNPLAKEALESKEEF